MGDSKKRTQDSMVPAESYDRVFQADQDGAKILAELSSLFHDRALPSVDPHFALYSEGQRSVVLFIISRIGEAGKNEKGT